MDSPPHQGADAVQEAFLNIPPPVYLIPDPTGGIMNIMLTHVTWLRLWVELLSYPEEYYSERVICLWPIVGPQGTIQSWIVYPWTSNPSSIPIILPADWVAVLEYMRRPPPAEGAPLPRSIGGSGHQADPAQYEPLEVPHAAAGWPLVTNTYLVHNPYPYNVQLSWLYLVWVRLHVLLNPDQFRPQDVYRIDVGLCMEWGTIDEWRVLVEINGTDAAQVLHIAFPTVREMLQYLLSLR